MNPSGRVKRLVTGVRRVRLWDLDFPNNPADFWQNMACPPIWNGLAPQKKKTRGVPKPRGFPPHAGLLVNKPPGNTGLFFT